MTDDEKLEALTRLLGQGAQISQLNFGDGTQNFFMDQKSPMGDGVDAEVMDAEVVDGLEVPVTDASEPVTEITLPDELLSALCDVAVDKDRKRHRVDKVRVMLAFRDSTMDWGRNYRNWRIAYECLIRLKLVAWYGNGRPAYAKFVRLFVCFCLPDANVTTFRDRISREDGAWDSFADWKATDKTIYHQMYERLLAACPE